MQDSSLRLIIVDDSLDDAEGYNSNLRSLGYAIKSTRVEELEELADALTLAENDLVLVALDSSDLSLDQVISQVKEHRPETPVIALVGTEDSTQVERSMRDGAADLVRKNNPDHLRMVVQRELDHIRRVRQINSLLASYRDSEKRCQVLMESSRDAIAYVHEGMHVYANLAYLELFGFGSFDEIEGTPIMDMVPNEEQSQLKQFLRDHSRNRADESKLKTVLKQANGSTFSGEMELSRATIDGEACNQIVIRDQTTSKELEKQLTELSRIDQLTGLFNRQYIISELQNIIEANNGATGAFIMLSLDEIQTIKSQVGVLGADRVVADIARTIRESIEKEAIVGRFEGSNFAILVRGTDLEAVEQSARKLMRAVERHLFEIADNSVTTTISLGICLLDENNANTNEVLSRAERALAEAIERGGNCHIVYKQKKGELSQKQIDQDWAEKLKNALQKNQFKLLYQPIVSITGDNFERYEVQLRLLDETGTEIPPEEFIPAAERSGMSKSIDRWVILNTLKKLVILLKRHSRTVFFVRLSSGSLQDGELFRWIHDRVKALKLPQGSLVFEFSEEAALAHLKQARAFSFALHKINCKIGLEEFGTGPNPFQLLKHVPADYLKVKREYVQDIASSTENQKAIRSITSKCREMNKATIAPMVEDAASLSILWGTGIELIQGQFLQGPSEKLDFDFNAISA